MVLISGSVRKELLKINDVERLYLQLIKWVGFRQCAITVEHAERYDGKSTYSIRSLFRLAISGWTAHSNRLLSFSIYIGFFFSLIAFVSLSWDALSLA